MSDALSQLILAHVAGDFLLQNEWMQAKTRSSFACTVHVAAYMVPFVILASHGQLSWFAAGLIALQHWLQDRFSLHLAWMKYIKQTEPKRWPWGALCVDQALHLTWIGIVATLFQP